MVTSISSRLTSSFVGCAMFRGVLARLVLRLASTLSASSSGIRYSLSAAKPPRAACSWLTSPSQNVLDANVPCLVSIACLGRSISAACIP